MTEAKTSVPHKNRVLTPHELELVDGLSTAMIGKATAKMAGEIHRLGVAHFTREIGKLSLSRSTVVWAEAHQKVGAAPAPTREQLTKGT